MSNPSLPVGMGGTISRKFLSARTGSSMGLDLANIKASVGLISPGGQSPTGFGPPPVSRAFDDSTLSLNSPAMNKVADASQPPRSKIICTIGPASRERDVLKQLLVSGMNVVRLNFSHGDHEYHGGTIREIRSVMQETRRLCAILLDTKGPEIRTGLHVEEKEVELKKGQEFLLVTDETVLGDNTKVSVQYANLPKVLKPGNTVLLDDGLISLKVLSINAAETEVNCVVENGGVLGQRKGVNLPGVIVDLPAVTQKDVEDITFGVEQGVDYIAASFTRKAADVHRIREVLGTKGQHIRVIAKIENQEGLDNFDEILAVVDGIMVARGDLGVEIPIDQVALAQKMMIRKCNAAGKFVITATQMLESMQRNPSPTRAEASDVANAVFDGTDCVMLSGETAKGKYPVEAVKMMAAICREAESATDWGATFSHVASITHREGVMSISEVVSSAAVKACFEVKAAVLLVLTQGGSTARMTAKFRPPCPILALTARERVARQLLVEKGVFPLLVGSMIGTDSLINRAITAAKKLGMAAKGDHVVIVAGVVEGVAGTTNTVKVQQILY